MAQVHPVTLRFVRPDLTGEVPSPPHDALSAEARRQHLRDHPRSYLGVTRAPDDANEHAGVEGHDVLEDGRVFLEGLLAQEVFDEETGPAYFIYRLEIGDHRQTGLVCTVATEDYDLGVVRIHERIDSGRAAHLARHLRVVGAQSSPIALAFKSGSTVADIMDHTASETEPMLDFSDENGLRQQLWRLDDATAMDQVGLALSEEPLYLIDGHHRAAAASEDRRQLDPAKQSGHRMLAALFPSDELRSQAFHRVLQGIDLRDFERRLAESFAVRWVEEPEQVLARSGGEVALALPDIDQPGGPPRWCLVDIPFDTTDGSGLNNIDPVRLARHVLRPLLGLDESGADPRLAYRPGTAGLETISVVNPRADEALFLMRPIPASTVMSVSDAGKVMPPKSTYFQPKVRSGIFVRFID